MRLRRARAEDVPALLALEERCYTSDLSTLEDWNAAVAHPKHEGHLLESNGCIVASLLLRISSSAVRIYGIQVDPDQRGKGYGRRLLRHAERRARAMDRGAVSLEVRRDNASAIAMYTEAGFRRIGTIPDYYEDWETAVRMRKTLD